MLKQATKKADKADGRRSYRQFQMHEDQGLIENLKAVREAVREALREGEHAEALVYVETILQRRDRAWRVGGDGR